MSELAQFMREPAVRFQRLLPGTVEQIWDLLVNARRLPGWFGDGLIESGTGGAVKLMGGHVRGTVTQWKPCRQLAYTWNVFMPDQEDSDYPESYLNFQLEQRGDQVLLSLTHMPVLERFEKQNAMGWHTYLDMVSAAAHGEPVEERSVYMKRNAQLYGIDLLNLVK